MSTAWADGQPLGLSDVEVGILAFERESQMWPYGRKEGAIRDRFDLSATHYYQRLLALLDRPEALAHDPVTINRLNRLRAQARRNRRRTPRVVARLPW